MGQAVDKCAREVGDSYDTDTYTDTDKDTDTFTIASKEVATKDTATKETFTHIKYQKYIINMK